MPIFYKRNLDSNIECCTIMLTEPTTRLFLAQSRWDFLFVDYFMYQYPKQSLTINKVIYTKSLNMRESVIFKDVYLLYPMYRYEEKEKEFPVAVSESPSGDINVHFIRMPFIFEENEDRTRQQLTDVIKVVFSIQKDHYYE